MRYGLTYQEQRALRKQQEQQERERRGTWRIKFAWFPVTLNDGTSVWLERYNFREKWMPTSSYSSRPSHYVKERRAIG